MPQRMDKPRTRTDGAWLDSSGGSGGEGGLFAVVLEERRGLGYLVYAACTTRREEFDRSLFLAVLAFYGGLSRSRSRGCGMVWYGMVRVWITGWDGITGWELSRVVRGGASCCCGLWYSRGLI